MSTSEINLRVTGQSSQGGRKYMEDAFVVAYQQTEDKKDLEYAFFGIFDGHGGKEAAQYAKNNLLDNIVTLKHFWEDDDEMILSAIRDGFLNTHMAMWKEVENWPKTASGLPSTAGTTASVAFIRKGKLYTGHVGDSRIVIGLKEPDLEAWQAESLTIDHKPESPQEKQRIIESGGLVMNKSGVERVVWKRPKPGHEGPILRSTDFEKIPFLAVARSLGDLWSYDYFQQEFAVSPEPDLGVMNLDLKKDKCLILASDGLWNIMSPQAAVHLVQDVENENRKFITKFGISKNVHLTLCNPSKVVVDCALERWNQLQTRADNVSVVTIMLDETKSTENEVLREQLLLKMNYPGSLPVWDVGLRSKSNTPEVQNEAESSDDSTSESEECAGSVADCPSCSSYMDNGDANLPSSSSASVFVDRSDSSRSNFERTSANCLQSCSNLLPEYFGKPMNRTEVKILEKNSGIIPRWSKNSTGRTSLLKLATWSKMVSIRRMSDPFPYPSFEAGRSDDSESYSDDESNEHMCRGGPCHGTVHLKEMGLDRDLCDEEVPCTCSAKPCSSADSLFGGVDENGERACREGSCDGTTHLEEMGLERDLCEEYVPCTCSVKPCNSADTLFDHQKLKMTLNQLCNLKQAIKRKHSGLDAPQCCPSTCELNGDCCSVQKRRASLSSVLYTSELNEVHS